MKLILISTAIGIPAAYYLMLEWLNDFPYRTTIGVELFIYSFLMTLLIALVTISHHAIAASRSNPAQVLRNE